MDKLVFLDPNHIQGTPFTTSAVIAEHIGVQHGTIMRLIRKHKNSLALFGKVGFEIRALPDSKTGQSGKIYHLAEEQATLLITFLKNTSVVVAFKTELVRQFFAMRNELMRRGILRAEGKPIRRHMTDVIQECASGDPWAYKHYTDLVYKAVTGQDAARLRKERGAGKHSTVADFLTAGELDAVNRLEYQVSVLLEVGMSYEQIKQQLAQINRRMSA